jgi:hypothetical protein
MTAEVNLDTVGKYPSWDSNRDEDSYYFFNFFGWAETEYTWPIVPAPDNRWWMWSSRWNENWQRKPKYSEKSCPSATLSITNPTWRNLGSNPGVTVGSRRLTSSSMAWSHSMTEIRTLCPRRTKRNRNPHYDPESWGRLSRHKNTRTSVERDCCVGCRKYTLLNKALPIDCDAVWQFPYTWPSVSQEMYLEGNRRHL